MSQLSRRNDPGAPAGFHLDKVHGKVAGVCAGIANFFEINPLIPRLVFVFGTLFGFGSFLLIYLVIWLLAD